MKRESEFKLTDCMLNYDKIYPGVDITIVTNPYMFVNNFPIGAIFYTPALSIGLRGKQYNHFNILNSFVDNRFRRKGIRTLLNHGLFKDYKADVIITHGGSDDGGLKFMRALGYKFNKESCLWTLDKKSFYTYVKKKGIELP